MSSHHGAGRAISMGYTNVFVMSEGTIGWTKAGKPTQKI
ncbi:hypothetical protein BH11MYX3_BH11MYX3_17210 [soil metagenome]